MLDFVFSLNIAAIDRSHQKVHQTGFIGQESPDGIHQARFTRNINLRFFTNHKSIRLNKQ